MASVLPGRLRYGRYAHAPTPEPTATPASPWQLLWSEEFDGPAGTLPDPNKWKFDLGGRGWGNQEWEYYTNKPENVSLDGQGTLLLTALQVAEDDTRGLACWYGPCRFTSARILTQDRFEFTYGRVEARLKIPYGQGIWPAFWMLGADIMSQGWPNCGEIDIMENIGREPDTVHGTVHGPGYSGANGISGSFQLPNGQRLSDDFHLFAIEWEPEMIRWTIDDIPYFTLTPDSLPAGQQWVFDHSFFLILNVAVGGTWPGYPDDTTTFPQSMAVDYVRVYQWRSE
ncbi:MAG: glycoside hydrolase family 16 protein [Chloroflexi bacterium]|nr:glycoside hydrolase family 16 protein [Chloroflexota bacterium]